MNRTCGTCTLCCRVLPIKDLDKPANVRCQHQTAFKGCAIYRRRPMSCRLWSCRWLVDPTTSDLRRPDRAHYVIDMVPDFVTVEPHDDSLPPSKVPIIQIWVDPAHRDAHRDPALRAWLAKHGENGTAALIRYSPYEAMVLWPPAMADGAWREQHSAVRAEERTVEELAEAGL